MTEIPGDGQSVVWTRGAEVNGGNKENVCLHPEHVLGPRGELFPRERKRPRLHSQAGASPPRLSTAMVALRSQGNWRWEGPLGTPLGLVHWKRASSPVEAGTAGYL